MSRSCLYADDSGASVSSRCAGERVRASMTLRLETRVKLAGQPGEERGGSALQVQLFRRHRLSTEIQRTPEGAGVVDTMAQVQPQGAVALREGRSIRRAIAVLSWKLRRWVSFFTSGFNSLA